MNGWTYRFASGRMDNIPEDLKATLATYEGNDLLHFALTVQAYDALGHARASFDTAFYEESGTSRPGPLLSRAFGVIPAFFNIIQDPLITQAGLIFLNRKPLTELRGPTPALGVVETDGFHGLILFAEAIEGSLESVRGSSCDWAYLAAMRDA